ncbi:hypothetical protein DFQ28_003486 [Apophysomyces sp. BC1034]|nr:hypothetical protein DFQ30_003347 [Apophysomyces sp. BC1015]KAG0176346.1 hypothetical protein DFQ29_006271 [Apophysomyces sp. BC1021]KAG0189404.1 hypothetical protein DFQ28_003486 [Apophysomyces sp. BC1034]
MCGFSAYFHFDCSTRDHVGGAFPCLDIDTSLDLLHHRGPDARGKYIAPDGRCALGHVRLSIIDLEGGQQPLSDESGKIHAVVNGELYDYEKITEELKAEGHTFETKSDSEIAVHLYEDYGLSFVEKLRGEFAICIWDAKRSRLVAARDRFGIKPLYYTVVNGTLLLGSEIKAFLPLGWKPEWDVESIMNNGSMYDYRTCFKGVYKLPPAHYLTATTSGMIEVRQYWDSDYPDKTVRETRSIEEMVQGVRERLIDAVRVRLRADVPLGIYLSGGIDSSAMAGIATHLLREKDPNARVHAFSISFKDGGKFDEGPIAERTAASCNAIFHKMVVSDNDLINAFEDSIWHVEMPHFNLNAVGKFLLSELVRSNGYKVVLTGEGSDEHFAGYNFFQIDYCREPDLASPENLRLAEAARLRKFKELEEGGLNLSWMHQKDYQVSKSPTTSMVNGITSHLTVGVVLSPSNELFSKEIRNTYGEPDPSRSMVECINGMARQKAKTKWHPLHTALYVENHTFLSNYLCNSLGDRSEMAHSVEARTPFMDHLLCEYVNNLPPSVKLRGTEDGELNEKWILKEAVKPFITEELYKRKKHPYIAPPAKGMDLPVFTLIQEKLTRENVEQLGFIDWKTVEESKRQFQATNEPMLYKDLLILSSYVVLSKRFGVPPYNGNLFETVQR